MNTEIQEPLYKTLQKNITKLNWVDSDTAILSLSGWVAEFKTKGGNLEQDKANAEYAALAVNNLHYLAEALELLIDKCKWIPKDVFTQSGKDGFHAAIIKAEKALENIS